MSGAPWLRRLLFPLLLVSALAPLGLLVLVSVGHEWFFPALWPSALQLDAWRTTFGAGDRLHGALITSFLLAIATGGFGVLLGWPLGRALAELRGWPRRLGAAAAFLPVALPPVGLASGLQVSALTLGLGGTFGGVLASHVVPAAGYTALYFLGVFTVFDHGIEHEARTLGARPVQVLWRVTVPSLLPQVREAFVLGFLVSWAQVVLTLVIGGGVVRTLPIEVFAYLQAGQDRFAATGALLLILPPVIALGALRLAVGRTALVLP